MTRRWLQPDRHPWLTTVICCALALLIGGEPANTFVVAVQQLFSESSSKSEVTPDEEGEGAKLTASTLVARRSLRKRGSSHSSHSGTGILPPRFNSFSTTSQLPQPAPATGAHAYRNGVGAALRC